MRKNGFPNNTGGSLVTSFGGGQLILSRIKFCVDLHKHTVQYTISERIAKAKNHKTKHYLKTKNSTMFVLVSLFRTHDNIPSNAVLFHEEKTHKTCSPYSTPR